MQNTTEATSKLQECLTSIYNSSRISTEINELEGKLKSLASIRSTLTNGDSISATHLDQMNKTISELEATIKKNKTKITDSEQKVIQGFLNVIDQVASSSSGTANRLNNSWKEALGKFSQALRKEFRDRCEQIESAIAGIKETKMDVKEKSAIIEQIEQFKVAFIEVQKANTARIFQESTDHLRFITSRVDDTCQQLNVDNVTANVMSKVSENLEQKMQDQLRDQFLRLSNNTKEVLVRNNDQIEKIAHSLPETIRKEIDKHMGPSDIQKVLQSLPEYQTLIEAGKNIAISNVNTEQLASLEAIKQSVLLLSSQLVELKQSNHATKAIVDTMRAQNLQLNNNADPAEFNHTAAVKRMEEMERQVTVIHNNVKMIETMVNIKSKTMEDQQQSVTTATTYTVGNKRARTDEGSSSSTAINISNEPSSAALTISSQIVEYSLRLEEVETKHQKLLDFILQCKDTVLDDTFPPRLEAALSKIEQILLNHERFIAFLIDPFTTSRTLTKVSIPNNSPEATLNPAMIDAISQLVKQTAEEISLPLQKKIKILEEKLAASRH